MSTARHPAIGGAVGLLLDEFRCVIHDRVEERSWWDFDTFARLTHIEALLQRAVTNGHTSREDCPGVARRPTPSGQSGYVPWSRSRRSCGWPARPSNRSQPSPNAGSERYPWFLPHPRVSEGTISEHQLRGLDGCDFCTFAWARIWTTGNRQTPTASSDKPSRTPASMLRCCPSYTGRDPSRGVSGNPPIPLPQRLWGERRHTGVLVGAPRFPRVNHPLVPGMRPVPG